VPNALVRLLEGLVILCMGTVVLAVGAEVASRALANQSLIITDELSRYVMIWTALLGAALVLNEDGHLRVTLLVDAVSGAAAKAFSLVAHLAILAYLGLLAYTTVRLMPSFDEQGTVSIGLSMAWVYGAFPLASVLMAVVVVARLLRLFRRP
jgi:TRAP-type C4-dicarboxylate transport system permease small subunit